MGPVECHLCRFLHSHLHPCCGLLCQKFPLKTLLWWGTVIAVPQMIPLLFIDLVTGALIAAVPIGLMGGVALALIWI